MGMCVEGGDAEMVFERINGENRQLNFEETC